MGVDYEVLLACPHTPPVLVVDGLIDLSFKPLPAGIGRPRFFFYDARPVSFDKLRDLVLELPWDTRYAAIDLQVLWENDYTHQDDSMWGREAPLSWHHAVWHVPKRKRKR